jgi:hypothetical protein
MTTTFDVMMNALDRTEAALATPVIDLQMEARKRRMAHKIEFHHMVKVGDRVFISWRRATGVIEELLLKTADPGQPDARYYGVFRVRLDNGDVVEEHPEHLTKSPRQS